MSVNEKAQIGTIDITPTWAGVLPIYLGVLENPNAAVVARKAALEELARMAKLADLYVAQQKSEATA